MPLSRVSLSCRPGAAPPLFLSPCLSLVSRSSLLLAFHLARVNARRYTRTRAHTWADVHTHTRRPRVVSFGPLLPRQLATARPPHGRKYRVSEYTRPACSRNARRKRARANARRETTERRINGADPIGRFLLSPDGRGGGEEKPTTSQSSIFPPVDRGGAESISRNRQSPFKRACARAREEGRASRRVCGLE